MGGQGGCNRSFWENSQKKIIFFWGGGGRRSGWGVRVDAIEVFGKIHKKKLFFFGGGGGGVGGVEVGRVDVNEVLKFL